MSNREKRSKVIKATREALAFKKQKRTVVSACAELLAPLEIEVEKLKKKVNFWRNMAYCLSVGLFLIIAHSLGLFQINL